MINPETGRVHTYYGAGGGGDRAARRATTPICRTSRSAPPKAAASAKRSSRRRAAGSSRPITRRSSCASWRTSRRTRACCGRSRTGEDIHRATAAEIFGIAPRSVDRGAAPLREGDQLRPDLRHVGVRACAPARHRALGGAAVHGPLFRALSRRRASTCSARARRRASDGYVETVFGRRLWLPGHQAAAARRGGRPPSAPRSTRRCRAPRPTSSRWR